MATYKVLGQSYPAAATATTLYTVPANTSTVVSTLTVCNTTAGALTCRVAVRPAGETLASKHYVVYDASVLPSDTTFITIGATLATTDVVTVYASAQGLSFNLFGTELS